jgi:hypothetical protein
VQAGAGVVFSFETSKQVMAGDGQQIAAVWIAQEQLRRLLALRATKTRVTSPVKYGDPPAHVRSALPGLATHR